MGLKVSKVLIRFGLISPADPLSWKESGFGRCRFTNNGFAKGAEDYLFFWSPFEPRWWH